MKAGFALRRITPPLGRQMEGFNQEDGAASVHDDLFVRALYLADGPAELVIVALDLLFMERGEVDRIKGAIGRRLGLLPAQVFLNFSHTHSGPRISRWHYSGAPSPAYLEQLEEAIIEAIAEARRAPQSVRLLAGRASAPIPISRRRPDENGKAQWGPYSAGLTCDELPTCMLMDESDQPFAILFSVSCHPTINHRCVISAEYPGVAVRELNARLGMSGAMFLQGAGGDTKPRHIAVEDEHFRDGDWSDIEAVGREVAEAVMEKVDAGLRPVRPGLHVSLREVQFALDTRPTRDCLEEMLGSPDTSACRKRWAEHMLDMIAHAGGLPESVGLQIHAVQLGTGVRLIGVEAELGSELGCRILAHYNRGVTFPLGYTNGSRINLPCDRQLPEGGYGVDTSWEYHWPAPLAPGIDERLGRVLQDIAGTDGIGNEDLSDG